jgi:formate/nitrite transporter FocA (FNT family)
MPGQEKLRDQHPGPRPVETSENPNNASKKPHVELDTSRRSAHEIFQQATELARSELQRPSRALAFSGLVGGMTMGLTGLGVASAQAVLGPGRAQNFIALLLYPVGFIAVIIGRAQLFTENTLYPVVLVLSERRHVLNTLRLWTVVFLSNIAGAAIFAWLAVQRGGAGPDISRRLVALGLESAGPTLSYIFWTGVLGGWLIALVAWTVTASHWTIGQVALIWLLAMIVGLGHFAHCIATSGEILSACIAGALPFSGYVRWILPATAGNIVGGVVIVSLMNYGQVL